MDIGGIIAICIPIALVLWFFIDAIKETKSGRGDEYSDNGPYTWDTKNKTNVFGYGFVLLLFIIAIIRILSK